MRVRIRVLCAAASVLALSGLGVSLLSSSASAQSSAVNQRVIVVFKNQGGAQTQGRRGLSVRAHSFRGIQGTVLTQLRSTRARNVKTYSVINAVSATVSASERASLKSNSAVKEVIPDQFIHLTPPAGELAAPNAAPGGSGGAAGSVCTGTKRNPQLEPEALGLMHAASDTSSQTAQGLGVTGAGVKVGFIADGLDTNNQDFIRPDGSHVFVDYKDFTGEGTGVPTGGEEAFGDASSIAAQGRFPYNVAGYGPHAVSSPCWIRVQGVAPGASLVGLDVFGAEDGGFNSTFLNAINYAVTVAHVNVLNESLGNNFYPDDQASLDVIKQANDAAVAAGVTVTASSGDAGSTSTIGTPATDPNVISTGATTSYRIDLQTGYGGAQFPGVTGYLSNDISSFSSGGYEQNGRTIDVVGPGELGWALCSTDTKMYGECTSYAGKPTPVIPFGGTSQSAPLTAGEAALVDQAYEKTHGTYPSPAVVKQIITGTADDINAPADQQGAGLDDAYKAVRAAESYKAAGTSPTPQGANLLKSSTQLNATDVPGTPETLTDTVTNTGATSQTVSVSSRTLGPYTPVASTTVTLNDASSPKTTDWAGTPSNYAPVTFNVAPGQDRLDASAAFQNYDALMPADPNLFARVRITLVDPNGKLAAYSVPQGDGNYGDVQVTDPAPGQWTAYIWSRTGADGGTQNPVVFGAGTATYQSFGTPSPTSLTLAPGQSAPVTLSVAMPATPGDSSGSLVFTGSSGAAFGRQTTVPVTLRSEIPTGPKPYLFPQTLTGGNGRGAVSGQAFYYQIPIGANTPELNASVQLADNPNNPFQAELIDPNGVAESTTSNVSINANNNTKNDALGAQLHALNPAAGTWTLAVAYLPTVSGTALTEPFTVSTNEAAVPASATGLPTSAATTLPAGQAQTVGVQVTNNGTSPESYFVDGRLPTTTPLKLVAQDANNGVTKVPLSVTSNLPAYLVPTDTTAFSQTASTNGATPIEFDSNQGQGDPDIESTAGTTATSSFAANPVTPGLWGIAPDVTGAYAGGSYGGLPPAPSERVKTAMSVTTAAFDPTVSSPTGDLWTAATNPAALQSLSPVIVGPNETKTIPVTITPTGASGTQVTGTLYVDDYSDALLGQFYEPTGSQVAAIPYSYTIK